MSLFDKTALYGDHVRAALESGEQLELVGSLQLAYGDRSRLRSAAVPPDRVTAALDSFAGSAATVTLPDSSGKLIQGFSFDPFAGGLNVNDAKVEYGLIGFCASGGADSVAAHLVSIFDTRTRFYYAVTDRRFLILQREPRVDAEFQILFSLPRTAIHAARHEPLVRIIPQRGRVLLTFVDGSMVALHLGFLFSGAARKLVAALSS